MFTDVDCAVLIKKVMLGDPAARERRVLYRVDQEGVAHSKIDCSDEYFPDIKSIIAINLLLVPSVW